MIKYKGYIIESHLTGWYSANTNNGIVKADSLSGIKQLINKDLITK